MLSREKQVRWAASYLSNSDSTTAEVESSAHSKQRQDPMVPTSWMSTTERFFCLFHSVFGQPTTSFFLAHPYMENPTREEGLRRSFSSGAERAGASALSGASVRDWGRRSEDKAEDASAPSISSNKRGKWRPGWTRDAGRRRWHQHPHHRRPCDRAVQRTDDDARTSLHTNIYRCEAWIVNM